MFAVLNINSDYFYSESPALKNEAKRLGLRWDNRSILPRFARLYTHHKDALRQSQKVSDRTGCVCAVVELRESVA